jgi:pyruvate dehydrogenase E1 component
VPLGTDGFGRSDTRDALRRFFEVDMGHVVVTVLSSLADAGAIDRSKVTEAIVLYAIDPDAEDPADIDTRPRDAVNAAPTTGRRVDDGTAD